MAFVVFAGFATATGPSAEHATVRARTDAPAYGYLDGAGLERVHLTLTNEGATSVYLPSALPLVVRNERRMVFEPGAIQAVRELRPGEQVGFSWDLRTTCLQDAVSEPSCIGLALPGHYEVLWDYALVLDYTGLEQAQAKFEIYASPP